jgi:hypothetical protein
MSLQIVALLTIVIDNQNGATTFRITTLDINDIRHTQHKGLIYDTKHKRHST